MLADKQREQKIKNSKLKKWRTNIGDCFIAGQGLRVVSPQKVKDVRRASATPEKLS